MPAFGFDSRAAQPLPSLTEEQRFLDDRPKQSSATGLLGFMAQRAPGAIFGFGPGQQKQFAERQKVHRPRVGGGGL